MKPKIRSITYSVNIMKLHQVVYQKKISSDIKKLKKQFQDNNIFVRTVRLNIVAIDSDVKPHHLLQQLNNLSTFSKKTGIRWFNVSFNLLDIHGSSIKDITKLSYEIIKTYPEAFVNFIISYDRQINTAVMLELAQLILKVSRMSFNGYDNFRVGISCNIAPATPFFPFSYAKEDLSFSLAIEMAHSFKNILSNLANKELVNFNNCVINELSSNLKLIDNLSKNTNLNYQGMDISLAPFSDENVSVVEILKLLGLDDIGAYGTLFLTSSLTNLLKHIIKINDIKTVGFNGVMYSLLEDKEMCSSNNRKNLSLESILSYSALCGCGLDMVPIPGNTLAEDIAAILLDVSAMAIRLNKPLGVRLLPIPAKLVNEFTDFNMDFLTDTRVLGVRSLHCDKTIFTKSNYSYL